MSKVFAKLNLRDQKTISVLNAPESFQKELSSLHGVEVADTLSAIGELVFALVFVTRQAEVDKLSPTLARKARNDATIWFAYPKGTSRKYACDFNRDTGWETLKKLGFDTVRQIAIDEDWTALRFRRVRFIRST